MANPQFIEQKPVSLVDVKSILEDLEKRDEELNYLSKRSKEYVDSFVEISVKKKEELQKKLVDLKLTRLKEEHIIKLIDYLPGDVEELKTTLQAYPLSLSKKDQDAIIKAL